MGHRLLIAFSPTRDDHLPARFPLDAEVMRRLRSSKDREGHQDAGRWAHLFAAYPATVAASFGADAARDRGRDGATRVSASMLAGLDATLAAARRWCDVTSTDSVEAAFTAVEEHFGGSVEVLVSNAGVTRDGLLLRMSEDEILEGLESAQAYATSSLDATSRGAIFRA